MSKISVIVPIYNAELYLSRCVGSILNQTFTDFDLILVNDGSRDGSSLLCNEYELKDRRVHVIHQENSGPAIARNKGIDYAFSQSDSKYLVFVDSDDYLHPQFLEYMYYATEDNMVEISMCQHKYISANEKLENVELYNGCLTNEISAENLMISHSNSFNYVWGKLFVKGCFKTLRFPESVFFGEDNLIIFKAMFESNRIVFIENVLYYYFYTGTGITKSPWTPKSLDVFEGIKVQLNYYAEHGYEKAYEKEIELYIQQYAYQIHRIREDKENLEKNKPYLKEMRQQMKMLLNKCKVYNVQNQFYWYEAVYPSRAKIISLLVKIKRNLQENGMRKTLRKICENILIRLKILIKR